MKHLLLTLMAAALVTASPVAVQAQGAPDTVNPAEASMRAMLERGLTAFNRGDFKGYLADFAPKVSYNELTVDKARLIEVNQDLKQAFPNLKMKFNKIRVRSESPDEAWATTLAEFTGETRNYDGSGFPATYRESGQVSAFYKRQRGEWLTDQVQVAWNDSYIEIGQSFGSLGFTSLPTLTGVTQPFRLRLWVGHDYMSHEQVTYAYTLAPLAAVLDKASADAVFSKMTFAPVTTRGLDKEMRAPEKGGTYVHVLVMNKVQRTRAGEVPIGQKIYTRLVRVED
jgi:hypothetical protein